MKKQNGINGEWIPVSPAERLSHAVLPTLVTLGTPAVIQAVMLISAKPDDFNGLALIFWVYGLLFWINSTGLNLFRSQRWEWSAAAVAEQRRYLSDARRQNQAFWAHWWVRFPIGIVFLAAGLQSSISADFSLQLISFVLLLSAFVTPFVFMAELALLPLGLAFVLGFLALVTLLPVSVTVMLSILVFVATIMLVKNRRASLPRVLKKDQQKGRASEIKLASEASPSPPTNVVAAAEGLQDTK